MPLTRPTRYMAVSVLASLLMLAAVPASADEAAEVRALLARGDLTGALQRAERAAAASPRDAQLHFLLGVVLMDLGRDGAALDVFMRMSEEYPELPDPYNNIALLRARAGELEQARQALESALRNDPGHRLARANLGRVHLLMAVQAWEQLGAQGPLDPSLQRQLDGARALVAGGTRLAR
jgi:Flp pilus assembly protein TadD